MYALVSACTCMHFACISFTLTVCIYIRPCIRTICMSIMHVESSAAVVATAEESRCRHLSGSYKGICAYSLSCYFVCKDESKDNVDGSCDWLQCWCYTNCGTSSSEIIPASPAPIQP
jgi:hypothetical protein